MKKKIYIIAITLVITLGSIIVPRNIDVVASGDQGDPELSHWWIYNKIYNMTHILFDKYDYWKQSRYSGTKGEQEAAIRIRNWMNKIGLDNVKQEKIDENWKLKDEKSLKSNYLGPLDQARVMKDFYINITIYNKTDNWSIKDYKNLSWTQCFPYFQKDKECCISKISKDDNIPICYNFDTENNNPQMELGYMHYSNPYYPYETVYDPPLESFKALSDNYKGYIGIDNNTESFFNCPPTHDHNLILSWIDRQHFFVNGSIGTWIENALNDNNNLSVNVSYYTQWEKDNITSYNVIGQINGTDPSKVSIICAHYDCMWNQGTIDEAAETALVLGIAKYIKDHELESKLKHTVKFIAFGAEEPGIRGAKDYIKEHVKSAENENIIYVINPGNFGHYNRTGLNYYNEPIKMNFELASDQSWLYKLAKNLTDALEYTPRTNETGPGYIDVITYDGLWGEDSQIFGKDRANCADACIQFSRGPYSNYHHDGMNHTKGDIIEVLDNGTFQLESEVVASVALHLLLDPDFSFDNCSNTTFDMDNDGNIDSTCLIFNISSDTNTSLFGNVTACLYNITTGEPASYMNNTSWIPFNKNNTTSGYLNVTLFSDVPENYYTARLVIKDIQSNTMDECNQTIYLKPYGQPMADFTWELIQNYKKKFQFTDESHPSPGASITNWSWDFGDGEYSTEENPIHWYDSKGSYYVTLTIEDSNGLNASKTKKLHVSGWIPAASFTTSSTVECFNKPITFTSTSSDTEGNIMNATWYYGDETVGYGNITEHSYSQPGVYTVTLVVTDDDGDVNTTSDIVYIAGALVDDSYRSDDPINHKWDTIPEGINDVSDKSLLYVFNGEYDSGITVNKGISIYGEDKNYVVINGSGVALNIINNSVLLDKVIIENATTGIRLYGSSNSIISNCTISNSIYGVKLENNADQNRIMHCNFTNNSYGIFISGSDGNIVGSPSIFEQPVCDDNVFTLNDYGVYIENADDNYIMECMIDATPPEPTGPPSPTWGICLDNSDNNKILFCDVYNASNYGIYLCGASDNTIMNCIIRENDKGIYLSGSSYNSIIGNNISDNSLSGVNILTVSSIGNSVFWNDFIRNGGVMFPQALDFGTGTNWNTSENNTFLYNSIGEGNHWDNYNGVDADGDGIGDTPYIIPGTANARDYYPVMEAYGWLYEWF